MIINVLEFTKARNQLKASSSSEKEKLHGLIQEFWVADTTAERLESYVELAHAFKSTKIKYSYNFLTITKELNNVVNDSLDLMYEVLAEELSAEVHIIFKLADKLISEAKSMNYGTDNITEQLETIIEENMYGND